MITAAIKVMTINKSAASRLLRISYATHRRVRLFHICARLKRDRPDSLTGIACARISEMDSEEYPVDFKARRSFLGDMATIAPTAAIAASLLRHREIHAIDGELIERSRRVVSESRKLLAGIVR